MPRPANPDVRRRLLDSGVELLLRNGYAGSGVQEVTASAGVPKGSFYAYFASKEAFAAAVIDHYWAPIDRDLLPILERAGDPVDRIVAFFRALADEHAAHDFLLGCLLGRMSLELGGSSDPGRDALDRIFARWDTAVAGSLVSGGLVDRDDPERAAALAADVVGAWEGAALRGKISRSRNPYDRFETNTLPRLLAHA